jgi:hypothetical protein
MGSFVLHHLQGRTLPVAEWPAKARPMDQETTFALLATGVALALAGALGGVARTRAPLAWHAHLPWNGIAFAGVAGVLFAAVHLYTLFRPA